MARIKNGLSSAEVVIKCIKTAINLTRMLGSFAAGLVLFFITGAVNGAVLNADFQAWMQSMGSLIHPPAQPVPMALWTLMSLIYGLAGVWIYAAIRPRFGSGPKTALRSRIMLWAISKLATSLDLIALGILPNKIIAGELIGSLVATLAAVFVGAWLYGQIRGPFSGLNAKGYP